MPRRGIVSGGSLYLGDLRLRHRKSAPKEVVVM